jgi:ribosome maturation factor RimP
MKQTVLIQRIDELVRGAIEGLGFAIVRIRLSSRHGEEVLQIMAEPLDAECEMTVEDCAQISRHVSAILDVEDPISQAYRLEISSPGIDRPLATAEEFARYIGHTVHVEMEWPVNGRKRFKGEILEVTDETVELRLDAKTVVNLEIQVMQQAKLALTDELIRDYLTKQKKQVS